MIYTVRTNTVLDTVKNELESKAKEVGFGVLHRYDFKQILQGKGFPIEREITLFEVCNPPAAQQALSTVPAISVYLPCRISIYEDNGQTVLGTIAAEEMLASVELDDTLKTHMLEIFETLKGIMHSWDS